MKKILLICSVFVVGTILGMAFGWRFGFDDGFAHSRIMLTSWIPKTRALSSDPKVNQQLDALAASTAGVFSSSFGFSPLMYFTHPKTESGFMEMLIYRDLHESDFSKDQFFRVASLQTPGALSRPNVDEMKALEITLRQKYPRFFETAKARQTQPPKKVEQGAAANP